MNFFFPRKLCFILLAFILISGFLQAQQTPKTFLWRITGNGLSKPSFLYGTIHLSDNRLFQFGDSLYRYLEQAEGFHIEVDADSLINASIRLYTKKNSGKLLKTLLARQEYEKYAAKLSRSLNKPADKITTQDIWLAKNEKTAEAYKKGNMENFMDLYLLGIAKKQGKITGGIEDVDDQLGLIDQLFDESDLNYLVAESGKEESDLVLKKMKALYVNQDLDGIQAFSGNSFDERSRNLLLTRRNLKMSERMDSIANKRSSFFAVGVAHLPGDSGVISLLRKRGFHVDPVFSSKKIAAANYTYKTVSSSWIPYTHELNLYKVESPGALQPADIAKEIMDMEYYFDLSTSKVYYTAVVNAASDFKNKDSVLTDMITRMSTDDRKLLSKKQITKQGYPGYEAFIGLNTGQIMQVNVFLAANYAYMVMVMTAKKDQNDADSRKFLESFVMTPGSSVGKNYIVYKDTANAFSVKLPSMPADNDPEITPEGGEMKLYTSTDFANGNSYAITVRNAKPGNYMRNDSVFLKQVKNNFTQNLGADSSYSFLNYQGYPGVKVSGTSKSDENFYQCIALLRGNRSYFAVVLSKPGAAARAQADSFMHSFNLIDYTKGSWEKRAAADGSFSSWLPPEYQETDKEELVMDTSAVSTDTSANALENKVTQDNFMYYDRSTGISYNIRKTAFAEYYFAKNDSTFFHDLINNYKEEEDSLVSFNNIKLQKDKGVDIVLKSSKSSFVKQIRLILHGDTLYQAFAFTPTWLANTENIKKFLNDFTIHSGSSSTTIFTNKTQALTNDLLSTDSAAFTKAALYLKDGSLNKEELARYHPLLLKRFKDFDDNNYNTNTDFNRLVGEIGDSSTVQFIADHYNSLEGEDKKLQYPLLAMLWGMEDSLANKTLQKLMKPGTAPGGEATILTNRFWDRYGFLKNLAPVFLSYSSDTTGAIAYARILYQLLDSAYISREDIQPYLSNFIKTADIKRARISSDPDEYYYEISLLLDLFGRINTGATNAKLQEFVRSRNLSVQFSATHWLLRNQQQVPAEAIRSLAMSDSYRAPVYDSLKAYNKPGLFPSSQLTQKLFAASYLYNYLSDDEESPSKIQFLREKVETIDGVKQKFFLFKVSSGEDEYVSHNLGIAGPFSMKSSDLSCSRNLTGLYWDEEFSAKKIDEHFDALLKYILEGKEEN